jgi:hypothetical protein
MPATLREVEKALEHARAFTAIGETHVAARFTAAAQRMLEELNGYGRPAPRRALPVLRVVKSGGT